MEIFHAFQKLLFCSYFVLITACYFCPVLMEKKTYTAHSGTETSEKPVQKKEKGETQRGQK
jgi:hypothetical protein